MRILLITLPRTGSKVLTKWISKELDLIPYDEPNRMDNIEGIEGDGVVVKWILTDMPNGTLNERWDTIILLSRENLREQGISNQRATERGDTWWVDSQYSITPQWIKRNQTGIEHWQSVFGTWRNELHQNPGIPITYESIYERGEGIPVLCKELGIENPKWLDMLHPRNRYRKPLKPI